MLVLLLSVALGQSDGIGLTRSEIPGWLAGPGLEQAKAIAAKKLTEAEDVLAAAKKGRTSAKVKQPYKEREGKKLTMTFPSAGSKKEYIESATTAVETSRAAARNPTPTMPPMLVGRLQIGRYGLLTRSIDFGDIGNPEVAYRCTIRHVVDKQNVIVSFDDRSSDRDIYVWLILTSTAGMTDGSAYSTEGAVFEVKDTTQEFIGRTMFRMRLVSPKEMSEIATGK